MQITEQPDKKKDVSTARNVRYGSTIGQPVPLSHTPTFFLHLVPIRQIMLVMKQEIMMMLYIPTIRNINPRTE